jgi:hypothetical protein
MELLRKRSTFDGGRWMNTLFNIAICNKISYSEINIHGVHLNYPQLREKHNVRG